MTDPQAKYYNMLINERNDQALQCGWEGDTEQLERYHELYDISNVVFNEFLDVGCGTGIASTIYPVGYTGIDINPKMIKIAKETYPDVTYKCESIFDHQGIYDLVVCSGAMNLFHQPTIDEQYEWFRKFVYRMCELGEIVTFNLTSVGQGDIYKSFGSDEFGIMMYDLGRVYEILGELRPQFTIKPSKVNYNELVIMLDQVPRK